MASNQTANFGLNQWSAEDHVLREEFNADNAKIDAAISACARIATGSYIGTGTYGENNPNTLTFDFKPKLVVIRRNSSNSRRAGAIFVAGQTSSSSAEWFSEVSDASYLVLTWEGNSVSWYTTASVVELPEKQLNGNGATYYYFAIG